MFLVFDASLRLLIMFVIPANHKWSTINNCSLIKVDWLDDCITLGVVALWNVYGISGGASRCCRR